MQKSRTVETGGVKKLHRAGEFVSKRTEVDEAVDITSVLGVDVTLVSVDFLKGNKGTEGKANEYCFIAFRKDGVDTLFGFSCGGMVVVRKMHEIVAANALPCLAKFSLVKGNNGRDYYDVE